MNIELLTKIFRFAVVGISGMLIDFSTTWVWKEKLRTNKYLANALGFSTAAINNFYINYRWTFESVDDSVLTDFLKFMLFALIGLALNNLLLYLFHEKLSMRFYTAKALAIVCVFSWNFATNYFFNFHS